MKNKNILPFEEVERPKTKRAHGVAKNTLQAFLDSGADCVRIAWISLGYVSGNSLRNILYKQAKQDYLTSTVKISVRGEYVYLLRREGVRK